MNRHTITITCGDKGLSWIMGLLTVISMQLKAEEGEAVEMHLGAKPPKAAKPAARVYYHPVGGKDVTESLLGSGGKQTTLSIVYTEVLKAAEEGQKPTASIITERLKPMTRAAIDSALQKLTSKQYVKAERIVEER